jgi:hypothetical protein
LVVASSSLRVATVLEKHGANDGPGDTGGKAVAEEKDGTTNPYTLARDKTAQTEPLTEGQKIVADWENNNIAEPCELATVIDMALIEAWERGQAHGFRLSHGARRPIAG